jgi:hypothetical protein
MSFQLPLNKTSVKLHVAYDGSIASVPVWAGMDPAIATMSPDADGLGCTFTRVGTAPVGGDFTIDVEGDPTPGVDHVQLTGHLDLVENEATTGTITADAPV